MRDTDASDTVPCLGWDCCKPPWGHENAQEGWDEKEGAKCCPLPVSNLTVNYMSSAPSLEKMKTHVVYFGDFSRRGLPPLRGAQGVPTLAVIAQTEQPRGRGHAVHLSPGRRWQQQH